MAGSVGVLPAGASPGREAQFDWSPTGASNSRSDHRRTRPTCHLQFAADTRANSRTWRYAEVCRRRGPSWPCSMGLDYACPLDPGRRSRGGAQRQSAAATAVRSQPAADALTTTASTSPCWTTTASAPRRIAQVQSHENGVNRVHAHYRLKDAIDQALILRRSSPILTLSTTTPAVVRRW